MRYSFIAAPLALAAGASAWGNGTIAYTTEVVTAFTTFCPYATSFVHASSTYVVTEVSQKQHSYKPISRREKLACTSTL